MINPEPDHKPLIGDDGELLQADTSFPLIGYVKPVPTPQPLPTGIRFAIGLLAVVGVLFLAVYALGLFLQLSGNDKSSQSQIQAQPTQFADHPVYLHPQFQLPAAQSATEWNTGLTRIRGLNWSVDGKHLAIAYGQNQVASLDTVSSQYTFKAFSATVFDWSPIDAQHFVAADSQKIAICENVPVPTILATLQPSASFTMPPVLIRWSTDGTQIAALSQDRKTVDIIYASDGTLAAEKQYPQLTWDIKWSPIMSSLLIVQNDGVFFLAPDNKLINQTQWDAFKSPDSPTLLKQASYASDGLRIALTGLDCDLKLLVYARVGPTGWIKRMENYDTQACTNHEAEIAWSPKAEQIATFVRGDDSVYLWNAKNGTIFDRLIPLRNRSVTTLVWSPDGQYLAIGSSSGVTIWSPTGNP